MSSDQRALLGAMFQAAVDAAAPAQCVPSHLPTPLPKGRTVVVGAGKASAAMAKAFEECWTGPIEGLVVTRYGHSAPFQLIVIVESAHPVPYASRREKARRILEKVRDLSEDDL